MTELDSGTTSRSDIRSSTREPGLWDPALIAVAFGTFVIVSSPGLVAIALPSLSRSLALSIRQAGWVQVAFQIGILSILLVAGQITERVGVRITYAAGCALFAVASFGGAVVRTVALLIGIRVVQGLGAALTIANNRAILASEISASVRGRAMGVMQAASGFGSALAIVAGGALIAAVGWQGAFWLMGALGVVAAVIAHGCLSSPPVVRPEPPDRLSTVLSFITFGSFAVGLAGLALGDWRGLLERSTLLCGGAALVAFVLRERYAVRPLAPWRAVAAPVVVGGNMGAVCIQAARAGVLFLVPFQLERVHGFSVGTAALLLVALPVAETLLAPLSGWVYDRVGPRLPTTVGAIVAAAGMVLMARLAPDAARWWIVCVMVVAGVGLGLFHSANNGAVMSGVSTRFSIVASSFLATSITLGLLLGAAAGSGIVAVRRAHYLADGDSARVAFNLALRDGFSAMAALAAVAAVASLLRGRHGSDDAALDS